jgi:hypothetical protein
VRVLLDAHISGHRVGEPLRRAGHDVRAANEEPELGRLGDAELLAVAASEKRILVTFNLRHFVPLLREWAEAGEAHGGCILVAGLAQNDFGRLIEGLTSLLADRPQSERWRDRVVFLSAPARSSSKR